MSRLSSCMMRPFSGDGCGCTNNCFDIDSPSSNVRSWLTMIWHDNISIIKTSTSARELPNPKIYFDIIDAVLRILFLCTLSQLVVSKSDGGHLHLIHLHLVQYNRPEQLLPRTLMHILTKGTPFPTFGLVLCLAKSKYYLFLRGDCW